MYTTFINNNIRKLCEDEKIARRKLGDKDAKKLFQRVAEIRAADNLAMLKTLPAPRCHPLSNNRKGQYAVDLVNPRRLVFLPVYEGEFEEKLVKEVVIIEVIDYH
jgi:proteic killer suppression protein